MSEILEKKSGEKATDPNAGNGFQTCLAIVIDGLGTGTPVVDFVADRMIKCFKGPQILREWARESDRKSTQRGVLIDFLEHLSLVGRVLGLGLGQDDLGYA